MRTKRIVKILAAAALSFFALSLTQCIVIPRPSSDSSQSPGKATTHVVTPKPTTVKPAPVAPVYQVGSVVSVTGTIRHNSDGYYLDDDRSNAVFKFVNIKSNESAAIQQNLNRRTQVRVKIVSVRGNVYQADFLNFGG